jgi:secreted trypsin-like serine protease
LFLGDSGGPILQWIGDRWEQVGIVSYGLLGCASANYPIIYARVAAYYDWIKSVLNINNRTTTITTTVTTSTAMLPTIEYRCEKEKVSCGCGFRDVSFVESKIIGGHDARLYSWSMVVSLYLRSKSEHVCAGTVLNNYYILTSARCVENQSLSDIVVFTRMHNRTAPLWSYSYSVERIDIHPNYTGQLGRYANDIAILHVPHMETNAFVTKTCVPRMNSTIDITQYPPNNTKLVVVGWGKTEPTAPHLPDILQQAQVILIDHNNVICNRRINDVKKQFCAGNYLDGRGLLNVVSFYHILISLLLYRCMSRYGELNCYI